MLNASHSLRSLSAAAAAFAFIAAFAGTTAAHGAEPPATHVYRVELNRPLSIPFGTLAAGLHRPLDYDAPGEVVRAYGGLDDKGQPIQADRALYLATTDSLTTTTVTLRTRNAGSPGWDRFDEGELTVREVAPDDLDYLRSAALEAVARRNAVEVGRALLDAELQEAVAKLPADDPVRKSAAAPPPSTLRRGFDSANTMGMLSGGRAIQENLALEIELRPDTSADQATIPLGNTPGLEIAAIDWAPYLAGVAPQDAGPLPMLVPEDNAALFAPSVAALARVAEQIERLGNPLADAATERSTNQRTRERIERQLLLPLDTAAQLLGAALVDELAITADDLYFVDGTGIAVLFRSRRPEQLAAAIRALHAAELRTNPDARAFEGETGGLSHSGVATPSRGVCSHLAVLPGGVVAVANSAALLGRVAAVSRGELPALGALDEWRFFRDRYRPGAEHEDALVVLSDPAIRKWTGPEWRIGQSRRLRAAAGLLRVAGMDREARLNAAAGPRSYPTGWVLTGPTTVVADRESPRQEVYGSLDFLTPIQELGITHATVAELEEYRRFREGYQTKWTRFFDPIAIQVDAKEGLSLDTTVMPLVAGTDYAEWRNGAFYLTPGCVPPTLPGTALRFQWCFHPRDIFGWRESWATAWLDGWADLTLLDDPVLEEMPLAGGDDLYPWLMSNHWRLPLITRIGSRNQILLGSILTAFRLEGVRAMNNSIAFETITHANSAYSRVVSRGGAPGDPSFQYATDNSMLTLSLKEEALRELMENNWGAGVRTPEPLGEHVALFVEPKMMPFLRSLDFGDYDRAARTASFANIPVLNRWRQLYPDRDPVECHRIVFGTVLECPGGQGYRWNEMQRTMESVVFGSPNQMVEEATVPWPRTGRVEAGLTFEPDGLRARVRIADPPR
ncbi:MAG: hypothetical protein SF028_13305 [Candidatus Sumerlaeia bacterium]|nr:hypothetical protein [Candidatus Sumerlaeia bacterium]